MTLAHKVCLVTGAAHGIGRATALRFAAEGAAVILADIDEPAGRQTESDVRQGGREAVFITADVSRPQSIENLFAAVRERFGKLHVLVNNAGITPRKTVLDSTLEDWNHCLDTNLRSAWLCARAAIPLMRAAGGGSIVNITSTHAQRTMAGFFPYAVSKGGLEALTRTLAVEYGPEGIRANTIAPGMIRSRRTQSVLAQYADPAEAYRRILDSHPLRRIGEPEDVARAAAFLASDDAAFITGATLYVDGGRHAQILNLNGAPKTTPA